MHAPSVATVARTCPACGELAPAGRSEVRARVPPGTLSLDEFTLAWASSSRNDCFFDYCRCGTCGLLYNTEYADPSVVDSSYSHMDDNTAGVPRELLTATQRRYLEALEDLAPLEGTYLEVGPDVGLATQLAVEKGSLTKVVLVEPNRACYADLKRITTTTNSEIVASVSDLDDSVQADRLVLIHVLDHLTHPREILETLRQRTAKGGLILVVVHDESSLLRRILGRRWPPFRLQHPQLFSRQTLPALLESCGFTVHLLRATANTSSLRHLVRSGLSTLGAEPRWIDRVPQYGVTVRLGNILAVAKAT